MLVRLNLFWLTRTFYARSDYCHITSRADWCIDIDDAIGYWWATVLWINSIFSGFLTAKYIWHQSYYFCCNSLLVYKLIVKKKSKFLEPFAFNNYAIDNTLKFPDFVKSHPLQEDEEEVSYDVESLFTSIPVKETIVIILDEIYLRHKIKTFFVKTFIF